MVRPILLLPLFSLLIALGCTTRFTEDFEDDTIGATPAVEPAGAPDDRISVLDVSNNTVVIGTNALDGTRSLRIGGNPTENQATVFMYAERLRDTSQTVYTVWRGRITPGATAQVGFFTGHFSAMVRVKLGNGEIVVNGEQVGTYIPGEEHSVILNATPSNDSYSFTFLARSGNHSHSGTVLNPSVFPQSNIGLQAILLSGSSSQSYTMDSINMSERKPPDEPSG